MNKVVSFIKESKNELQKVTWPTKKEAIKNTISVIGIAVFFGLTIGAIDYGFTYLVQFFIK